MCRLIESIRIDQNGIHNLSKHEQRMNVSRKALFNIDSPVLLRHYIHFPKLGKDQILKCRVIYDRDILKIEYISYLKKDINRLKIVYDDEIEYNYKYENRDHLNKLLAQKGDCEDVLIVKYGLITDTSFCNIVFFDGENWVTPRSPLLKGTMRTLLLENGKIFERDILIEDIFKFEKFKLINAMFAFQDKENPIENIND